MTKVAIDITASGVSPEVYGEMIAISICEMLEPGKIGRLFHSYVRPERRLAPLWHRLLEIDPKRLESAPPLTEVAEKVFAFIGDRDIVCLSDQMVPVYLNDALDKLNRDHLPRQRFTSIYNLLPDDIFLAGLEEIDKFAEIPPETDFASSDLSQRVAQMYWTICGKLGLN